MTKTTTLIAYGSLMSGLGLTGLAPMPVADAWRVRLTGCRRGFGKLSQYGDRFAMVLESTAERAPIRSCAITAETPTATDGVDALAYALAVPELARVAQREGYRADALLALARHAERSGQGLGRYLFGIAERAGFDVAAYRRTLAAVVDYTSPHYVPHPVASETGEPAIVFLPPGAEGSGRDDVVPIRVQSAETRLLTFRQVWRVKPNPSQLDYAATCILAEAHNLSLADVLGDVRAYPPLAGLVDARLASDLAVEASRFRAALGLSEERYAVRFPVSPRRASFLAG
jgi:hypothetical protein